MKAAILALTAIFLIGLFSPEIADTDFWWTLKSGQYIVDQHRLPAPDPFAFTTASAGEHYAGEAVTRQFNLTFEWLSQACFYSAYRAGGFPAIVLLRALLLTVFCGLVGLVTYRRSAGFYRSLAAALAAAAVVAGSFTLDRSYLFTFAFLAGTIAILEYRRFLWALPLLCLVWANCHGGFFLSWIVLGAYSAEALYLRWRKTPQAGDRELWIVAAASFLVTGVNPNGFRVIQVLALFRGSFLQSKLLEWMPPTLWPPSVFSILLVAAAGVCLWERRRVRIADGLLLVAFGWAALTAQRNTFLIAFLAPVLIASYLRVKFPAPKYASFAAAALLIGGLAFGLVRGNFFQLRVAEWRFPKGAADFLLAHHVTQPMLNTYEFGGYLMWRLWPQERVFIDGRALSESVFLDYAAMIYNRDNAQQLLDRYGIQVIVMNTFEYSGGLLYNLAPSLADPNQHLWKLVYNDPQAVVLMRDPPQGVQALRSLDLIDHMESECGLHIERDPRYTLCARTLGQVFSRLGVPAKARDWLGVYLTRPHPPDPEAEQAYAQALGR